MSIQGDFLFVLSNYLQAKSSLDLLRQVRNTFAQLQNKLHNLDIVKSHPSVIIDFGTGIGRPAHVPWLALMDSTETVTTLQGTYVAYLFSADMSGVYAVLTQGVGASASKAPIKERLIEVQEIAQKVRAKMPWLKEKGFNIDPNLSLKTNSPTGKAYEKSTIAYKFYNRNNLPSDETIRADLKVLFNAYDVYLQDKPQIIPVIQQTPVNQERKRLGDELTAQVLTVPPEIDEFIAKFKEDPENEAWLERKKKAFDKWRDIFDPANLQNLSREDFQKFLTFNENQSWDGIQRQSSVYSNMDRLRRTLLYLLTDLNEIPLREIKERLDNVLSSNGTYKIPGLGKAVVTGIMHICDTRNRLSVWNSKVTQALKVLRLYKWNPQNTPGQQYLGYNTILRLLGRQYGLISIKSTCWCT